MQRVHVFSHSRWGESHSNNLYFPCFETSHVVRHIQDTVAPMPPSPCDCPLGWVLPPDHLHSLRAQPQWMSLIQPVPGGGVAGDAKAGTQFYQSPPTHSPVQNFDG